MSKESNKDVVMRINRKNHARLKELMKETIGKEGKEPTANELMEELLDTVDTIKHGKTVYIVDEKIFEDVSLARGEAIMKAVKKKDVPVWPKVAVIVGEDHG